MDKIWGILFVTGLAVPAFLTVASVILVYKLARKLRSREPASSSARKMVALHISVVVGAAVLGHFIRLGFLELAAVVLVPLYLVKRLRRTDAGRVPGSNSRSARASGNGVDDSLLTPPGRGIAETAVGISQKTARRIAWIIGASGVLLPWVAGLGVKFYLQSQGRPTLPIRGFVNPSSIPVLLLLTMVMWSSPFLVLAALVATGLSFGRSRRYSFQPDRSPVWWTYSSGMVTAVAVFVRVFWEFDSMLLLVPVSFFLIPPMAVAFWIASRLTSR